MALGELGLALDYFYSLTPREFSNILSGYRDRQESEFRDRWERTRRQMWAALAPHQKKGSQFTPGKLIEFPWDKPEAVHLDAEATAESVVAAQAEWEEIERKLAAKRARGEDTKRVFGAKQ